MPMNSESKRFTSSVLSNYWKKNLNLARLILTWTPSLCRTPILTF